MPIKHDTFLNLLLVQQRCHSFRICLQKKFLQEPAVRLLEGGMTLRQLPVEQVHERPFSALGGGRPDYRQGGGGESGSGAAQRAGGIGAEGRAAVAQGHAKTMTTSGHDDDNDNKGEAGGDGGHGGSRLESSGVCTHKGLSAD